MDKSLRFVGLGFWLSWILLRAESPCLFLSSLSVVLSSYIGRIAMASTLIEV